MAFTEDAAGNRTAFSYDPATGRKTSQTDALSRTVYYQYNLRGQMTRTWGAALPVRYEFDDLGRMIRMHTYKTKEGWDTPAWPTQNNDLSDITTWHYHPASGQLTSKEDAQAMPPLTPTPPLENFRQGPGPAPMTALP